MKICAHKLISTIHCIAMLLTLVEAFLVVLVEFLASIQPLEECGWRDIPDTYMASLNDVLLACWSPVTKELTLPQ